MHILEYTLDLYYLSSFAILYRKECVPGLELVASIEADGKWPAGGHWSALFAMAVGRSKDATAVGEFLKCCAARVPHVASSTV